MSGAHVAFGPERSAVPEGSLRQSYRSAEGVQEPWRPSPKQDEFQRASEFEVLYGGAAGGGKSDGLLVDALGLHQNAILKRDYQALLMRRTYPDLKDLIDRSRALYERLPGARYNKGDKVWTFPSGARIEFGYAQYDSDRFDYRGRAFQYMGFDELTLFPTDTVYTYLLSRVRSVDPTIKCYVRATTNPDGPGSQWVKDRWRIPREGTATCFEVEYTDPETKQISRRARRFIPARLADNPYLAESGYRETLLMLAEDEQRALLLGRWEEVKIKGAIYAEQMESARVGGRIRKLEILPNLPMDSYWDIGRSDHTSFWLKQRVGPEVRWLLCYENRLKPIEFYVQVLFELAREHKFLIGKLFLPHDADYKRMESATPQHPQGRSIAERVQEMMPNHQVTVVPRVDDIMQGIQAVRTLFPSFWFNEPLCKDGIAALENYRFKYDEKRRVFDPDPLHDWTADYADALRQFAQWEIENPEAGAGPGQKFHRQRRRSGWRVA